MPHVLRALRPAVAVLVIAALGVAIAMAVHDGSSPSGSHRPASAPRLGPPPKVFAFVSDVGGGELRRLERFGARIDVIAPNWYGLDAATGALHGPDVAGTRRLRSAAHRHRVRIWPTVNALTAGSRAWEPAAAQQRIVAALLRAAHHPGARGVTLDMEELRPTQRAAFSALVARAAARLHAAHRGLAVYVSRPGPGSAAAYDWAALARSADLVLTSGYNEHWSGGAPGPTTTSAGFSDVLAEGRRLAGRKAAPVLGAFGYRWSAAGTGTLLSSIEADRLRRRSGARAVRHDGAATFRVGTDTIFYETADGLRARVRAARAAHTRWIALFSLGREPVGFWRGLHTARFPR